jgi:hypothetical protein
MHYGSLEHKLSPPIFGLARLRNEGFELFIFAFATEAYVNLPQCGTLEQVLVLSWQETLSRDVNELFKGWGRPDCTYVL